jgi:hypothetical protein
MKKLLVTSLLLLFVPAAFSGPSRKGGTFDDTSRSTDLNGPASPNDDQSGKAVPAASVSPGSLDFRDQIVKAASVPQRITVTNTGPGKLHVASASIAGDNWEEFRIVSDTCTGGTVDPQRSCIIDISFIPGSTGPRRSSLVFKDDAPDTPQKADLSGNGINSVDVPPSDFYQ